MAKKIRVPKALIDEVTRREGKKKSISRAQVSEVLRHTFDILAVTSVEVKSVVFNGQVIAAGLASFKKVKN